ncbi:MAG: aminotransferase class V-fold PLP-dependent enzyme [Deltaproteobacteria bacterium]|nr:aminotransferase class V-fold PLP-dependent enzyme [Deltaproteobacteria bacterium]
MSLLDSLQMKWERVDPRLRNTIEALGKKIPLNRMIRKVPFLEKKIEDEIGKILKHIHFSAPYLDGVRKFRELPRSGLAPETILPILESISEHETKKWQDGFVSGAVYHGDADHIQFLNKVYSLFSQTNPLHSDLWPSLNKFEAEIVAMTADLLGASHTGDDICGCVTSGGSESILLAMKTYRDWAKETKGISQPELVLPVTAHAAFEKACQYFKIKKISVPIDQNGMISVADVEKAITTNTIALVASAPNFPHGIVDPVADLARLAQENQVGLHVDACLGAFILPFVKDAAGLPPFDFSLTGVTSMSADTHKFGYASKGSSVILYRSPILRRFQYFVCTDWPGGLYTSPTFAGSRSGAVVAQCWAAMVNAGWEGYERAAKEIYATTQRLREEIERIPHLHIIGNPLFIIALKSDTLNIFSILGHMAEKGWSLNGLHRPNAMHLCVTRRHTQEGVADRFVEDLRQSVQMVEREPGKKPGLAPIYGLASSLPARGLVGELLRRYLDRLYQV